MGLIEIILIAIGLTFDTFAVSVSTGLVIQHIRFWQAIRIAFVLAFIQAVMPIIGWFSGSQIKDYIMDYDHWIAFGLLGALGTKMIVEALKPEGEKKEFNPMKPTVLIGMAVATSIDALVVGVSFAFLNVNIIEAAFIIGIATTLVAMLGMLFGKKTSGLLGKKMEIIGGLVLVGIGLKILIEHLCGM